ncbi:coronin like protein [Nitzschia inconspicua]|uniref:Coronin n=1 Tax=Nitzschia inconspicua TaxID=303405 RepID=A0A9K3L7J0_9STRA|nr:coronin like protein [Nitzschia inconspicua]
MFKIRQSKYRHVFCDQPKNELCYTGFRVATATGDQQYIKASTKYWAVAMFGGGGPLIVGRHDRPGRFEDGTSPILKGHSGAILDTEWSPFDDSLLATASEDSLIKLWSIPEDWEPTDESGLGKKGTDFSDSMLDLDGHSKKVTLLRFHPTAANTLLSTSADYTVKVWDIEAGQAVSTFDSISDLTQDIVWDVRGDKYAASNKDKAVRIVDGRTGKESSKIETAHEGVKSTKIQWMGESGKILTTGASKQSGREMKVWDIKNLSAPLHTEAVDTASGALIPLYDQDTSVLYLCGKGDGQIRLYEFEDKGPHIFKLTDGFRSTVPGKGYCTLPKRGLDIMDCETTRILKLTNKDGIHPLRFIVPRKSDAFQDDIFPPAPAPTPAHTCAEWLKGSSKLPVTMKLDPQSMSAGGGSSAGAKKTAIKTVPMLTKELSKMKRHIQALEKKLKEGGISYDAYKFSD